MCGEVIYEVVVCEINDCGVRGVCVGVCGESIYVWCVWCVGGVREYVVVSI